MVDAFKESPAVLAARENPRSARSVLNYMMGCDTADADILAGLSTDEKVGPSLGIWFMSGTKLDEFAQPFAPVVRELKAGTLTGPEWETLEGKIAKVLLGDQLSRSCFRGTSEAFEYDPMSRELVRALVAPDQIEETLKLPCAFLYLLPWALAHSEELADLDKATEFVDLAIAKYEGKFSLFKGRNKVVIGHHRAVVKHFGRYPQRNMEYGREHTPEEKAWMDDKEALPLWAGNGAAWNMTTKEWLDKMEAMMNAGEDLPISKPKQAEVGETGAGVDAQQSRKSDCCAVL